jgi:hypothetical protein
LHVCGWLPVVVHCVVVGVQVPVQFPAPLQTYAQAAPFVHCPVASQVWGTLPLHCLAPGLQTPVQVPALQTLLQAAALTHLPVESQL